MTKEEVLSTNRCESYHWYKKYTKKYWQTFYLLLLTTVFLNTRIDCPKLTKMDSKDHLKWSDHRVSPVRAKTCLLDLFFIKNHDYECFLPKTSQTNIILKLKMPRGKSKKSSQLKNEKRPLSSEKTFACDICHKRYSHRQSLSHKWIHTDKKPSNATSGTKVFISRMTWKDTGELILEKSLSNAIFLARKLLNWTVEFGQFEKTWKNSY